MADRLALTGIVGLALVVGGVAWRGESRQAALRTLEAELEQSRTAAARAEEDMLDHAEELAALRRRVNALEAAGFFDADAAVAREDAEQQVETRGNGASLIIVGAKGPNVQRLPAGPQAAEGAKAEAEAVDAALKQAKEDQLATQGADFVTQARARVEQAVDSLVAAGSVDGGRRQAVVDLLEGEAEEVWELKAEVQRGELDQSGAIAEYEEIRAGYDEALGELIGAPAAEAVRLVAEGGGKNKK